MIRNDVRSQSANALLLTRKEDERDKLTCGMAGWEKVSRFELREETT